MLANKCLSVAAFAIAATLNGVAEAAEPWIKTELNQIFMSTLSKSECVNKTMASISATRCATNSCVKNYSGIVGDCVVFAKGSNAEFCKVYDKKYITQYCSENGYDGAKCGLVQGLKTAIVQTGFCKK